MEERLKSLSKNIRNNKGNLEESIIEVRDYYIGLLISKDWVNLCDAYDDDRIQIVIRKEYKSFPFDDVNIRLGIDDEGMWWSSDEEKTQNPIKSKDFLPSIDEIEKAVGIICGGKEDEV